MSRLARGRRGRFKRGAVVTCDKKRGGGLTRVSLRVLTEHLPIFLAPPIPTMTYPRTGRRLLSLCFANKGSKFCDPLVFLFQCPRQAGNLDDAQAKQGY